MFFSDYRLSFIPLYGTTVTCFNKCIAMIIEIIPFKPEFLPQAGELLAGRHADTRQTFPELPARFEEAGPAARAVDSVWKREGASGFAAFVESRMAAFLIGDAVIDPDWGHSGWIRAAGWACTAEPAAGRDAGRELLRDLYSRLGELWVEQGILTHVVLAQHH